MGHARKQQMGRILLSYGPRIPHDPFPQTANGPRWAHPAHSGWAEGSYRMGREYYPHGPFSQAANGPKGHIIWAENTNPRPFSQTANGPRWAHPAHSGWAERTYHMGREYYPRPFSQTANGPRWAYLAHSRWDEQS
jgi:hypothetical protein